MFAPGHLLGALPTWPHRLRYTSAGIVGTVAAVLTTISLVPQLLRVWSRRSAKDVSLGMFLLFSVGVLLWFFYGVMIHSVPVEVANGVSFVFALAILCLKLHFDRREGRAARRHNDPS
ncbi:MAG: SemiSWEET transporter [Acidobacteriaceae bacterium]